MENKNIIQEKSYQFALEIIKLYKVLTENKDFIISRQILRSGTSIGANVEEAIGAQSKKDFIMKMQIAYKEARETFYWLRLLGDSAMCDEKFLKIPKIQCEEILKILSKILQTSKSSQE